MDRYWQRGGGHRRVERQLFEPRPQVSNELVKQIHLGYIGPIYVFFNWTLEVLNAFGTLCFIQGTMEFQETFGWTHFFANFPKNLGYIFVFVYRTA